jgi:hypothetical protein
MAQNYFENDFTAIDWIRAHFGYDCSNEFLLKQGFDQKTIDEYWELDAIYTKAKMDELKHNGYFDDEDYKDSDEERTEQKTDELPF